MIQFQLDLDQGTAMIDASQRRANEINRYVPMRTITQDSKHPAHDASSINTPRTLST